MDQHRPWSRPPCAGSVKVGRLSHKSKIGPNVFDACSDCYEQDVEFLKGRLLFNQRLSQCLKQIDARRISGLTK